MTLSSLLKKLGYLDSDNYLNGDKGDFDRVVDYGHLFRRATKKPCHLRGVYALKGGPGSTFPVVYVCDVKSESDAKEAHRLIWNQDTVPFLIVNSPKFVRVYPGFSRAGAVSENSSIRGIRREFEAADIGRITETLSAQAIDSGNTWRSWGALIRPEYRVNWGLLNNLRKLDAWLQGKGKLHRSESHALIGQYVYLHYLRDRDILSNRKMERWRINISSVFGKDATVIGYQSLISKLDDWLNGEVFPIDFGRRHAPGDKHIQRVAATFNGDKPHGDDHWQLHLAFKAYDFSYIPIEVLSVVYEQFLHMPEKSLDGDRGKSRGRSAGAYYTPIPVVNFMLSELEDRRPLQKGMRVFDPACGSGAFLVQAYRRLIEKEFPPSGNRPSPDHLKDLLQEHFIGLDTDEDACSVTRLSLILTLLDYVHPPDLETKGRPGPKPRLPTLRDNILCGNFFDSAGSWQKRFQRKKADWLVGNPPWKQLKKGKLRKEDKLVLDWMQFEEGRRPVGNRQVARAFAWRVSEFLSDSGEIALFLPAMTLFETAARKFRENFLKRMTVHSVANFSNLRWVISAKRFTAPAAAFFYRPRGNARIDESETIRVFSPLVANQEAIRPVLGEKRKEAWNIILNAGEIRDVPLSRVADGNGLQWKIASWGSSLDAKLLRSLIKTRDLNRGTIGDLENRKRLIISEGLQLRQKDADEELERVTLPSNAKELDVSELEGMRDFFALPRRALKPVYEVETYGRKGRVTLPMSVCQPPHVVVSAASNYAVYSDVFFIMPGRQIGIASPTKDKNFLKAVALYLSSDLAFYCEFFLSTELGVDRDRSTLKALRMVPTPLLELNTRELKQWAAEHDVLADATRHSYKDQDLWGNDDIEKPRTIGPVLNSHAIEQLNSMVYDAMTVGRHERTLIQDFVRVRFSLNDGKLGKEAVRRPRETEMEAYGRSLQEELDVYISDEGAGRHIVQTIYSDFSGMVKVTVLQNTGSSDVTSVMKADASEAAVLQRYRERIRKQRSQWVYFDRNLRVYDRASIYILKPMQRLHWTRTQARVDAMDIVAESMGREGEE